ncbi:MAG: orotidine-5-phosphate decarboxylase, partial [Rhodospirillales bacterium]|nr:orotidine-5-phosphate decarboxylase [Rhodospirillales bacterium]
MIARPRAAHARIIAAIDTGDAARAQVLSEAVASCCGLLKIGLELFCAMGPPAVARPVPVFLDLKLHDIPNTVAGAVR